MKAFKYSDNSATNQKTMPSYWHRKDDLKVFLRKLTNFCWLRTGLDLVHVVCDISEDKYFLSFNFRSFDGSRGPNLFYEGSPVEYIYRDPRGGYISAKKLYNFHISIDSDELDNENLDSEIFRILRFEITVLADRMLDYQETEEDRLMGEYFHTELRNAESRYEKYLKLTTKV